MKNRTNRILILIVLTALMMTSCTVYADGIGPNFLMTGETDRPVIITVSSPVYRLIAQFGKERTDSFNKLMNHLAVSVAVDGNRTETTVLVDSEPVYSYTEETDGLYNNTVYSIQPETVFQDNDEEEITDKSSFIGFLDNDFFRLNRMLDDFYPVFEKAADAFGDYAKTTSVSLNFSGYGKGVKRVTIPLPAQFVSESFPKAIADLADSEECGELISKLLFSGPQKMILLYDQNDQLLRINYDGNVGFSEESMRKVSVVWRCVRRNDQKKDHFTMKTPAIKGYDKYNVTYERVIDLTDADHHQILWNMQLDVKAEQIKKKTTFKAELVSEEQAFSGNAVYTEKKEGNEIKLSVIPHLQKENGDEYNGTIEINNNSGKILTSSVEYSICISPGRTLDMPGNDIVREKDETSVETSVSKEKIQEQLAVVLIRRLLSLPAEDIGFLSMDIPEEIWDSLLQSLI